MKVSGKVVEGSRLGRTLGYPTANIAVSGSLNAASGVYAARVWIDGDNEARTYGAMANLGVKPTFGERNDRRILELHLFDFEGDLYGRRLSVELVRFIRPEQKFATPEALRLQIGKDETNIKIILECI